jgi:anti-anti-sigma factor
MPEPASNADRLLVTIRPPHAIIRVIGRGSFKNSTALKDFSSHAVEQGILVLILDMAACAGMDSTFMGVLAGLALRLEKNGGSVELANLNERMTALIATLGLDLVVRAHPPGGAPPELAPLLEAETDQASIREAEFPHARTAETMLEAHETLVRISPDNLPKFRDVIEYLREDVQKLRPGADHP